MSAYEDVQGQMRAYEDVRGRLRMDGSDVNQEDPASSNHGSFGDEITRTGVAVLPLPVGKSGAGEGRVWAQWGSPAHFRHESSLLFAVRPMGSEARLTLCLISKTRIMVIPTSKGRCADYKTWQE